MAGRPTGVEPAAVLIGSDCITGLQSARILRARGIEVIGIVADARHPCTRTRAVGRTVVASRTYGDALLAVLDDLARGLRHGGVLIPCTDASVSTLSEARGALPRSLRLPLAPHEVVHRLMDKLEFLGFAEAHGLAVPATRILRTRADAERAAAELGFPCILKPAVRTAAWEAASPTKVHRVRSPDRLLALFDRYTPVAGALVVQEWIEGPDSELYSFNGYFDGGGRPLATFIARKLRQWPPRAGTSCLGEECRNDEVLDLALRTFGAARYHGLAYLEVKRDTRTGRHLIIEANVGRPTGRSAIAEAGGVELLHTMYCDAAGLPLPAARQQRYGGAKWIYWRKDVQSALHDWRAGELTLRNWASSLRGRKAAAVLSWSDPVPFLLDVATGARKWIRRRSAGAPDRPPAAASPGPVGNGTAPPPPPGAPPIQRDSSTTFFAASVVRVLAIDASPADLRALERVLGRPAEYGPGRPDLVVRFVDRLPRRGFRHIEVGRSACTEEGYIVRAASGTAWARIPFAASSAPREFVCERGAGSVPLLRHFVRVAALANGYLPFHASAFEWQGRAVLVAGWSHGGKTSALLAFGARGARYVGDDLVLISKDGRTAHGLISPITLSAFHMSQLPRSLYRPPLRKRLVGAASLALTRASAGSRSAGVPLPVSAPARAAERQASRFGRVVLPVERIFHAGAVPAATPEKLFLMLSTDEPAVTVRPIDAAEVAERMSHSQAYEWQPLLGHLAAFRFSGHGGDTSDLERLIAREPTMLRGAIQGLDAYEVRHPYPVPFESLFRAMRPHVEAPAARPATVPAVSI